MSSPQLSGSGLSATEIQSALQAGEAILGEILRKENMLQAFAERWREQVCAEAVAIFLVDGTSNGAPLLKLKSESNANKFKTTWEVSLPVVNAPDSGLTSHLAYEGKIAALSGKELQEHPYLRKIDTPDADFLTDRTSYSLLGFPLKNRKGQLLGFIKAQNKLNEENVVDKEGRFSEKEILLASIMATRLVTEIESTNLFRGVGQILRTRPVGDLDSYLRAILPAVLQVVGADRGSVSLWQEQSDRPGLYVRAQVGEGLCGEGDRVPDQSVISTVWEKSKTVIVTNVKEFDGAYFEANSGTKSELTVLLAAHASEDITYPLGVLNAEAFTINGFDAQDGVVFEALAADLSSAIDIANQDVAHKQLLRRCTSEVIRTVDQSLDEVLRSLQATFGFDGSLIYEADHSRHLLALRATLGCTKPEGYSHDCEQKSLAAHIFRTQEPIFVADPLKDDMVLQEGLRQFGIVGPLLGLPLIYSGRVVGVLLVWSKRPMSRPRDEHRHRLYPFACVAAGQIAVGHAYWLLDETLHQLSNRANILSEASRVGDANILASETAKLETVVRKTLALRKFRRTEPEKRTFSLRSLVEEYNGRLNVASRLTLRIELNVASACDFHGDRAWLAMVIDELVDNAVRHSPPGSKVSLSLAEDASVYMVRVIDEGPGIPAELEASIWDPYKSFGPNKGSGLGLPIARGIALDHGGTLKMNSGPANTGACFTLTLPRGTACN